LGRDVCVKIGDSWLGVEMVMEEVVELWPTMRKRFEPISSQHI